jgi:hypothetical protein
VLAAGCGGDEPAFAPVATEASAGEGPECAGGETEPLREEDVVAALGRHGIETERDPFGCADGEAYALVGYGGAGGEGMLGCKLRRSAEAGDEVEMRADAPVEGYVSLELANLACFYSELEAGGETAKRAAALRRAFDDLRGSLR